MVKKSVATERSKPRVGVGGGADLNRLLRAITEVNRLIVRETETDRLLAETCRILVEHGGFHAAWIGLRQDSGEIQSAAAAGIDAEYLQRVRIRPDDGFAGLSFVSAAIRTGVHVVHDAADNPVRTSGTETEHTLGGHAAAALPLRQDGELIGAVTVYAAGPRAFASAEIELLQALVNDVGHGLQLLHEAAARRRTEEMLRESEERFRSLTELSSDWYWEQDAEMRFTLVTRRPDRQMIIPSRNLIGQRRWELPDTVMTEVEWEQHKAVLAARLPFHDFVLRQRDANGEIRYRSLSGVPIFDALGEFKGYRGIGRDVTERVRAEAEMRKLSSAIQHTADAVLISDRDGVIEYVNAAFEHTTGYTRAEVVGRNPSLLKSGVHKTDFYQLLWKTLLAGQTFSDVFVNRKKNGELYYEEKTITPLRDDTGQLTHFIATGKDISERMQAQERLHYLAHHDALTELPNRVLFLDRLNQTLSQAQRHARVVGVMFLDLDRFKNINDTLGHDVGDALLKAMAVRLRECVRASDSVARFGGDEFAILLADVALVEDVSLIARKVLNAFTQPFVVHSHELFITPSIGISLYPTDGVTGAVLLKNADAAMYRAKDAGKNNFQFYSVDMTTAAFERFTLETSLRHALARGELVLHYQPQVELRTGRLLGVEALVRWQHPEFGLLDPTYFIAIAEETGAIVPMGEWVARTAMLQTKQWREAGMGDLRVAINVSARQLGEPGFVDGIARLLHETGLPAEALELEITESVIMKNPEQTIERLHVLHSTGVHFAVDDFGTGYSSLSYLRRFPIHTLKIDQSFIRDLTDDSGDAEIVKTIIAMARGLKLAVIAEGVETREQLVFLQGHDCHAAQGYLFSRPLPVERMTDLLTRRDARPWLG